MDYLFTKATAIEALVTGLCLYKIPNFTLIVFGIIGASRLYEHFNKAKSNRLTNESMKATFYHPNKKYEYLVKSTEIPGFSNNQILIKVEAASINPVDYKLQTPLIPFLRWFIPHTVGRDFSGTIIDKGENVQHFQIGEKVYGNALGGSLQEFSVANENQIGHRPSNLSSVEAAGTGLAGLTSLQALTYWGSLNGKKVLIIGASGGCGSLGVQIAKYFNATVYGVCSTKNAEMVKNIGADVIIDYHDREQVENLKNENFDLIYDTVTSPEDPNQEDIYRRFLKSNGKYVAINASPINFLRGILGWERKNYHCHLLKWNREDLELMKKMVEENKLKPKIDEIFTLDKPNVKNAFDRLRSRRTTGKICFEI